MATSIPHIEVKLKFYSVHDRMPAKGRRVLLLSEGSYVEAKADPEYFGGFRLDIRPGSIGIAGTHWAYLPATLR